MKRFLMSLSVVGVVVLMLAGRSAIADDKEKPEVTGGKSADVQQEETKQVAYLGIAVEPLHPAFWAHLRDVLEHKQGLLVAEVTKDSPAEKAGLKEQDILTTYGDQRLFSPEQLAGLVQADKAGQQVKLGVARDGKSQEINVTLGEHTMQMVTEPARRMWRMPGRFTRRMPSPLLNPMNPLETTGEVQERWSSFDSLMMKSLGNDRYQVDIGYETKDGKIEHRKFEGTRAEIHQALMDQKDLPNNEREHLLRALDMRDEVLEFDLPQVYFSPDGREIWDFSRLGPNL